MKRKKLGSTTNFTVKRVSEVLLQHNGYHAPAAAALGVGRSTLTSYIAKHPELRNTIEDCQETRLDTAEIALDKAVKNGEAWGVCFLLKCKGQKRGYIEKQQIDVSGEINQIHSVDLSDRMAAVREIIKQRQQLIADTGGIDRLAIGTGQDNRVVEPTEDQINQVEGVQP
jgi:hypothetical protein